jgi:exopolysaccharide biosynthesis WecB/TagA/CpsF family protein
MQHVFVAGMKVATAARAELAEQIVRDCVARRSAKNRSTRLLFDANGHGISLAARDRQFREALEQADVIHVDGGWIVLASRYLAGAPVAERSATTDVIHDVAAAGLEHGLSHYLLGGTEQVNAACAQRMLELYPGLVLAGRKHGYFSAADEARVADEIAAAAPDVVWIGLGKPREQQFAAAMRERLGASWAITCGGCFNYITGDYPRAPRWMQDNHLEWLFRAVATPRLIWRFATTSPHAMWLAVKHRDRRVVDG